MGPPRHLGPGSRGSGHGPFGQKAFKAALLGCVVLIVVGVVMVVSGADAASAVGTAFIVLALFGLVTSGAGLLLERLLGRRPPPPPNMRDGNGRGSGWPPGRRRG